MKIFISHKYANENMEELEKKLNFLCEAISVLNHEPCCLFSKEEEFRNSKLTIKQLFQKAFDEIDSSDIFLVFVDSSQLTTGMFMELGYAIAKNKRVILLIKKNVESNLLRGMIDEVVEFENVDRLKENLNKLKLDVL